MGCFLCGIPTVKGKEKIYKMEYKEQNGVEICKLL